MDKTTHECNQKFQQSGRLCAAKWTGRPGPSAKTVQPVSFCIKTFAQNSPDTWLRHL
jgi:hypothetical protein